MPELSSLAGDGLPLHHPVVSLHRGWRCDHGVVLALAGRFDEEARGRPPLLALHQIGRLARALVVALARCPLERGQPEATVAAVLARPAAELPTTISDSGREPARAGLEVLASLGEALAERVAPHEPFSPPFTAGATALSSLCRALTAGEAAPGEAGRAFVGVALGRDAEWAITHSLRQQLYGGELLLDDSLPAGLLRAALVLALSLTAARLNALAARRPSVTLANLSAAHMIAKRTLNRPEPRSLLAANAEQAWPVLDALALLAEPLGRAGAIS